MDIIFIDDLRASTLIGIYPREKAMPQTIEISLQIGTSTASAGASDDIRDTIDYAVVVERLRAELAAATSISSKGLPSTWPPAARGLRCHLGARLDCQARHDARRAARRRGHRARRGRGLMSVGTRQAPWRIQPRRTRRCGSSRARGR
jgi:hypothetical protein